MDTRRLLTLRGLRFREPMQHEIKLMKSRFFRPLCGLFAIAAFSTSAQAAEVDAPYFLKFSVYENLPGIQIADLFAGSFPNNPVIFAHRWSCVNKLFSLVEPMVMG